MAYKERVMTDIPPLIAAMRDTLNRGDATGYLALFAPDAVVDDWGSRYQGLAAIRDWSQREQIDAKGHLTITRVISDRDGVVVFDTDWQSSFFSGPGRFAVTLKGGKIVELRISETSGGSPSPLRGR
jgi:ketosteroid isomerase-like protein